MFEGLVSSLLKTYIGKYVHVNQEKLSIGLLSGVLELENASLRLDAINSNDRLPFVVKFGHIGKIKLSISWNALRQSPWSLIAENINIIIGPKTRPRSDKEEGEEEREQAGEQDGEKEEEVVTKKSDSSDEQEKERNNKSNVLNNYENKWFKEVELLGINGNESGQQKSTSDADQPPRLHVFSYLASFAYSLLNNLHVSLNDLHIR